MSRGPSGADRTRRLVALLGMLEPDTRISIAELAAQAGVDEARLTADLECLSLCGIPPYDPGDCMPLIIEDGYVEVFGELPALKGPVRLSSGEASALASALQAVGFEADDGLTSRLLAASAGTQFDAEELRRTISTATTAREADTYRTLADALTSSRVVRIDYERAGASGSVERDVEPLSLFAEKGSWYLMGWCRRSAAWRTFRLDRIRRIHELDETCDAASRGHGPSAVAAFDAQGLPLATLVFARADDYVAREWPGSAVLAHGDDGTLTVTVPFAGTDWIARAVVSWLGAVRVNEPAIVREAVAELATTLLDDAPSAG